MSRKKLPLEQLSPAYRKRIERAKAQGIEDRNIARGHKEQNFKNNNPLPVEKKPGIRIKPKTVAYHNLNQLYQLGLTDRDISKHTGIPEEDVNAIRNRRLTLSMRESKRLSKNTIEVPLNIQQASRLISVNEKYTRMKVEQLDIVYMRYYRESGFIIATSNNGAEYAVARLFDYRNNTWYDKPIFVDASTVNKIKLSQLELGNESEYSRMRVDFGVLTLANGSRL